MSRREPAACAVIARGALTTVAASPAAADAQAPRKATLTAIGGPEFKLNRYLADTLRFPIRKLKITARKGENLSHPRFIHPWMQGRLAVR